MLGFALGATSGGWIGWSVGYPAWHWSGGRDLAWGVLFFLIFVGVLFGLVAPLTLVRYVSDKTAHLGGEAGDAFMADSWAANYVVDMVLSRGRLGDRLPIQTSIDQTVAECVPADIARYVTNTDKMRALPGFSRRSRR